MVDTKLMLFLRILALTIAAHSAGPTKSEVESRLRGYMLKDPKLLEQIQITDKALDVYTSKEAKERGEAPAYSLEFGQAAPERIHKFTPSGNSSRPLEGLRVLVDPGHFGGKYAMAEERYVKFDAQNSDFYGIHFPGDGHDHGGEDKPHEGDFNLRTALAVREILQAQGAEVRLTKNKLGEGAIGMPFETWLEREDLVRAVVDDRVEKHIARYKKNATTGEMEDMWPAAKTWWLEQVQAAKNYSLGDISKAGTPDEVKKTLGQVFALYNKQDITFRARQADQSQADAPHLTLSIHYNADGTRDKYGNNSRSKDNHVMGFVPGSFMANELSALRFLKDFSRILENAETWQDSVKLCDAFVRNLSQMTGVRIAEFTEPATSYLPRTSMEVPHAAMGRVQESDLQPENVRGVFARNLDLNQQTPGIFCMGEAFIQNNPEVAKALYEHDSPLIQTTAAAYARAVLELYDLDPAILQSGAPSKSPELQIQMDEDGAKSSIGR